jgi:hypothetical protein
MMDLLKEQVETQQNQAEPQSKNKGKNKRQPLVLHLGIAAVGFAAVFLCTGSMRKHAGELASHFSSGNWEVTTDEAAVETNLRAQYGDPRQWSIHYVGGTSNSFPLALQ